ncbi:cobalamin-5'-phosphate synthase [Stanieria cyanosphaera PCC 7437]|uniref:Cobalamin-5'-phosphate synthase n=1 Tax=Stanieria cyanosphaera (strain ATCC 29371 / PCC 7437) TaxID=111780 RepID=K9XVR8_STAC7|nr:glycine zipper family protein [Stanieria cyanosphaera]AFZ35767.1 cobalamin-5'-phosphate synthase [Stanieria cyanosphaera PCC 7437]
MEVIPRKRGVGLFSDRRQVELAVSKLKNSGFPMEQVAIIVRNAQQEQEIHGIEVQDYRGNHTQEGAVTGILTGGAIGSITGLLVGLGVLAIPGIGPILLAGAEATALVTALAGGTIGGVTGGLVGALIGLGIPETRVKIYRDGILNGDYLIVIDGTESQLVEAQHILDRYDIEEWKIYEGVHQSQPDPESRLNLNSLNSTISEPPKQPQKINNPEIEPRETHEIIEAENLVNQIDYEPKNINHTQLETNEIIEVKPLQNQVDYEPKNIRNTQLETNEIIKEKPLQNQVNYELKTNTQTQVTPDNSIFPATEETTYEPNPQLTKSRIARPVKIINNKPKVIIVDLRD